MGARRLSLGGLVWLCALVALALVCSAPAVASRGHVFGSTFGSAGSGNAQFKEPDGVAVNEATGDVYVVDKGDNRVEWLNSTGTSFEGQFDGSGSFGEGIVAGHGGKPGEIETGRFEGPEGIAVDNSCFSHKPVLTEATSPTCKAFDPSNGDVYVVDAGHQVIDKFTSKGEYLGQLTETPPNSFPSGPFHTLNGVAVNSDGVVWVYQGSAETVVDSFTNAITNEFTKETHFSLNRFGLPGLAVDSEDNFYVRHSLGEDFVGRISKINVSGTVLIQEMDVEKSSAVAVERTTDDSFVDNLTTVGVFDPAGGLLERLGSGHLAEGSGIGVDAASGVVYVADLSAGVVDRFVGAPPSAPTVEGESVSDVTGSSATFGAELDPRSESFERVTEYHFEYGVCVSVSACSSSGYEESLPAAGGLLAADFGVHGVSVHPQDLRAGTVYHFRVVVGNAHGVVDGEGRSFTTQVVGGELVLPDGRGWELVSPPDKLGSLIQPISETGVVQAAANGGAITYLTDAPTEVDPRGETNAVQVLSTRGLGGWGSLDIAPPHGRATGASIGEGEEYRFFSEDLSAGVVQPFGSFDPGLSGEASEQTAFLHSNYLNGDQGERCVESCYHPLVTGKPGYANVQPGLVFGECPNLFCGPTFVNATPDLSHVLISSSTALIPGAQGLDEWAAGKLTPVEVLPKVAPGGEQSGEATSNGRRGISDDGSRVVWASASALYTRDVLRGETVQLDAGEPGCVSEGKCTNGGGRFQIASADGSRVFFTDMKKLTRDAGASPHHADLYECELVVTAGELKCELSDLTPLSSGESASVQGSVLGASKDGSRVYFVADGTLGGTPGAVHGTCGGTQPFGETCNLYVIRAGGPAELVTVLSGEDSHDWSESLGGMPVRVSPDGEWLEFMSQDSLTGYDNHDAVNGQPDAEVFLYDASKQRVVCASCNPTGARPSGREYHNLEPGSGGLVGGPRGIWEPHAWVAANVPGWTVVSLSLGSRYQPRYLSDSGRVFFDSNDDLVPRDVNGTEDVYQYEPPDVGGCTSGDVTFSERSDGCIDLISAGSSAGESAFLDASENGSDVFFLTSSKLVSQDYDASLDVYDARECAGGSRCFPTPAVLPPPCSTGDACKAAPSPQPAIFGAPASATFSGRGNVTPVGGSLVVKPRSLTRAQKLTNALRACRKKSGGKRSVCVRRARARYGPAKPRKNVSKGKG